MPVRQSETTNTPFFHFAQVLDFDHVAVDQFGAGRQVAAELFFRRGG